MGSQNGDTEKAQSTGACTGLRGHTLAWQPDPRASAQCSRAKVTVSEAMADATWFKDLTPAGSDFQQKLLEHLRDDNSDDLLKPMLAAVNGCPSAKQHVLKRKEAVKQAWEAAGRGLPIACLSDGTPHRLGDKQIGTATELSSHEDSFTAGTWLFARVHSNELERGKEPLPELEGLRLRAVQYALYWVPQEPTAAAPQHCKRVNHLRDGREHYKYQNCTLWHVYEIRQAPVATQQPGSCVVCKHTIDCWPSLSQCVIRRAYCREDSQRDLADLFFKSCQLSEKRRKKWDLIQYIIKGEVDLFNELLESDTALITQADEREPPRDLDLGRNILGVMFSDMKKLPDTQTQVEKPASAEEKLQMYQMLRQLGRPAGQAGSNTSSVSTSINSISRTSRALLRKLLVEKDNRSRACPFHQLCTWVVDDNRTALKLLEMVLEDMRMLDKSKEVLFMLSNDGWCPYHNATRRGQKKALRMVVLEMLHVMEIKPAARCSSDERTVNERKIQGAFFHITTGQSAHYPQENAKLLEDILFEQGYHVQLKWREPQRRGNSAAAPEAPEAAGLPAAAAVNNIAAMPMEAHADSAGVYSPAPALQYAMAAPHTALQQPPSWPTLNPQLMQLMQPMAPAGITALGTALPFDASHAAMLQQQLQQHPQQMAMLAAPAPLSLPLHSPYQLHPYQVAVNSPYMAAGLGSSSMAAGFRSDSIAAGLGSGGMAAAAAPPATADGIVTRDVQGDAVGCVGTPTSTDAQRLFAEINDSESEDWLCPLPKVQRHDRQTSPSCSLSTAR